MRDADLHALTCPYCRGPLEFGHRTDSGPDGELLAGTVKCPCYEYPLLDDILVLRQTSDAASADDVASIALRSGDVAAARSHLVRAGSMVAVKGAGERGTLRDLARKLAGKVREAPPTGSGHPSPTTGRPVVWDDLVRWRPPLFRDYLYLRYANPSFVAAVPLLMRLDVLGSDARPPTVLDIGCGIGHSTAMLRTLLPSASVVAADPDFVNLMLLRRHFVSDARCICVDAELPLPFRDDAFDGAVCLDAFHYIRSKWALARELDRVVIDQGVWLLPHLHNAIATNVHAGVPLAGEDYRRLLDFAPTALLDESRILEQFLGDGVVDMEVDTEPPSSAPVFSIVASRRADVWGARDAATQLAAVGRADVGINPVYRTTVEGSVLRLVLTWPDRSMADECAGMAQYLPASLELDRGLVDRVRSETTRSDEDARVEELLRAFVLVHLPPGYHRHDAV